MSEEIDYAEMLEIPVATVNVVKKKRLFPDLKLLAVGKVNERMQSSARSRDKTYAGTDFSAEPDEGEPGERTLNADPSSAEVADSHDVVLYDEEKKRTHPVLIVEFAVACLLCLTIFLTNIFLADSAINTFIRTVLNPDVADSASAQPYSEFTLTPVVSEFADVELTLSSAGLLSFTAECSVYPACDGTVSSITQSGQTYTVVVSHSSTFESVYTGLTTPYYAEGATVRSNVPFAYTDGTAPVQVSFYQDGEMLNCYSVDAQNCLSWNE